MSLSRQIVCKYFIEAIESRRYGWFWQCPNGLYPRHLSTPTAHVFQGDNCQYRHALPPGFVLKSEKKAKEEAEKANTISIEEFLETEVQFLLNPWRYLLIIRSLSGIS